MPSGLPDLTESLTLVGLGSQPNGVAAKRVQLYDSTGATMPWPSALGNNVVADSLPVVIAVDQPPVPALGYAWNGTGAERLRTPNKFLVIAATAITAGTGLNLLTVDPNMRFRMLGYRLSSTANAAFLFGYGATATVDNVLFSGPLLAVTTTDDTPYLMNGVVWPAGQSVHVDVTATSTVTGTVWGTYEISPSGGPA